MALDFCKWPVIAGCIVGGIILISIIWCFFRCCICGYACCACCCGGCGGSRKKRENHIHTEYINAPPPVCKPPAYHESPQYAYATDRDGNVNADTLPVMPTWETTRVEVKEEVEMDYVNNDNHRKNISPSPDQGYQTSPPMQRGLTPAPDQYGQQQPQQRVLTPGPLPAPIPVSGAGQKLGFNPRGPSPGPNQYEDRGHIQGNYGLPEQQFGQPSPRQNPYDMPYQIDHPNYDAQHGRVGGTPQNNGMAGGYPSQRGPPRGRPPPQQQMYPEYEHDGSRRRQQEWTAF